jgi:hypothetical protein
MYTIIETPHYSRMIQNLFGMKTNAENFALGL